MNKKLNRKIFSGVLALSFVFGSGLVSTVSENLGLEYSNVAYAADSIWDIPKDDKFGWIRTSTLDKMRYPYVYAETPLNFTFKNGKVHYETITEDYNGNKFAPLPDKGYTWEPVTTFGSQNIGSTKDFLRHHGYEVRQEEVYGDFEDPYREEDYTTFHSYDANEILIWSKTKASDDESNHPKASTGVVKYSGETLNVTELYSGGTGIKSVTFSNGQRSKTLGNVTTSTNKNETLKVTFTDDSTTDLQVSYTVKPLSEKHNPLSKKVKANSKADLTPEKAKEAIVPTSVPSGSKFEFVDTTTDLNVGDNTRKVKVTYPDTSSEEVDVTVSYLPDDINPTDYDKLSPTDKKLYSVIEFRNADKTTTMVRLKSVLNERTVKAPKPEPKDGYTVEWELTAQ